MDKEFLGYYWLKQGFSTWFRCLFRLIESTPFIVEPLHDGLFEYFDKLYNQEVTRLNINVPPRSGKTTLATYLVVYALTKNPKSNIIYTSFSQTLLNDIASREDILYFSLVLPTIFFVK